MLGSNKKIIEYPDLQVAEKFTKYMVSITFMHGSSDGETKEEMNFISSQDALEWHTLWNGIKELTMSYDGLTSYAHWVIKNIDRERALIGDDKDYFIDDKETFEDRFDERIEAIEDALMDSFPFDTTSNYNYYANCIDVQIYEFDKEKSERREMGVADV